jgi:hypothetical protein
MAAIRQILQNLSLPAIQSISSRICSTPAKNCGLRLRRAGNARFSKHVSNSQCLQMCARLSRRSSRRAHPMDADSIFKKPSNRSNRYCEPSGRAKRGRMTGKQSSFSGAKDGWIAWLLDEGVHHCSFRIITASWPQAGKSGSGASN